MSSKKKSKKQCWVMQDSGTYILQQNINDDQSFNGDFSVLSSPYITNNLFFGDVVKKKAKSEKISETLCTLIEIHPNTMQLCGLRIGGPIVLSSTTFSFAARVWPNNSLPLDKISLPSNCLSLPGFSNGNSVYAIAPENISTADSLELLPVLDQEGTNQLKTLLETAHFLKYLSHFLDKSYAVIGQNIEVIYFGKTFTLKVENATSLENETTSAKGRNSEVSIKFDVNGSITEKLHSLSLNRSDQSFSYTGTSTPLKAPTTFCQKKENVTFTEDIAKHLDEFCHYFRLNCVYLVTSTTKVVVKKDTLAERDDDGSLKQRTIPSVTFDDIGGLKEQIDLLSDIVIAPVRSPGRFKKVGIEPMHGVLLHGPSGTGKSLLAKAVASELGANVKLIAGSQVIGQFFGESEAKLREVFDDAKTKSPCVVIIDEIDALCPRRDVTRTDAEKRLVATFTSVLDELNGDSNSCGHVVVIGTTNRLDAIEPALRRSGRFDREVEVSIPTASERADILKKLLRKFSHNLDDQHLRSFAESCHGYVGADLVAVCKEAGLRAVKGSPEQGDCSPQITVENLTYGLKQISPSAMRELTIQVPKVLWEDIGGNNVVKQKLRHTVEWPLKNPDAFTRLGIDPPRGVLLYGPPGCSKTLTARALATESGLNFISIKGPELFSKYVGDSERAVRKVFSKARSAAPCIVFIDELDALAIERGSGNAVADRVLATLLTEMDGVELRHDVIVVAATNRPEMIDKAFLRPGRIDRILYVPLPDSETRREIFRINFRKMPIASDVDLDALVKRTESYSGAEIASICREAALSALDSDIDAAVVSARHFDTALSTVIPQTSSEMTELYEKYERTLQSGIK